MTRFRYRRKDYEDSMKTAVRCRSMKELTGLLHDQIEQSLYGYVQVLPYGRVDPRNGWDEHVVCVDGVAVGITDGRP